MRLADPHDPDVSKDEVVLLDQQVVGMLGADHRHRADDGATP
jgi:hypothetical protein